MLGGAKRQVFSNIADIENTLEQKQINVMVFGGSGRYWTGPGSSLASFLRPWGSSVALVAGLAGWIGPPDVLAGSAGWLGWLAEAARIERTTSGEGEVSGLGPTNNLTTGRMATGT